MASFRVHEDQENRLAENRQKMAGNGNGMQKRAVLGAIDNVVDLLVKQNQVRVVYRVAWPPLHLFAVCSGSGQFEGAC